MLTPDSFEHPPDVYLSDVSDRDRPWDKHAHQRELVSSLYRLSTDEDSDFWRYADRMNDCSQLLDFIVKSNDAGEFKLKLQTARFCRVRHCPVCQWRKSMMWRGRFINTIPKILKNHPNHRFIFLTLTIKSPELEELRSTITQMNKGWERLVKLKKFPAEGFVKSLEVTRGKDDRPHPHFHALLMVPNSYFAGRSYMSQSCWQKLWQNSLRIDYSPQVDVRCVRDKKGSTFGLEAIKAGVLETLKYSVKPGDLTGEADEDESGDLVNNTRNWFNSTWLLELTRQMHNVRAISIGGVLKKYFSEDDPEDLIHPEGQELDEILEDDLHLFFGWRSSVKKYALNQ